MAESPPSLRGARPSGTVTFLFTDIEGSTQLWEKYPDLMRVALARHDGLLRQAFQAHGGYVVKMMGDGAHVAFATAADGLAAAVEAQRALQAEPWDERAPIRSRMGIHVGAAEERGGDYYGPVLNRAARLMSAGYGGQILLSQATHGLVRDHLPSGVTLRDLGKHRLKDLSRPEQIYQLVAPDLPATFPALKTLDALPHNLPIQLTSFVGRDKEIAQVKEMLADARLVTLTGIGGAGKTRLALHVAAELAEADYFHDGIWFVDLAAVSDPNRVPQAIADALRVREEPARAIELTLTDHLIPKNLLLVLDNCEHLIDECERVVNMLVRECRQLKILATSREALGIIGERIYRVPSLESPDIKNLPPLGRLAQYDAVRLFFDRARATRSDFAVTEGNAGTIAQICQRLDGIPLAIELAAALVKSLKTEELAARLDDRFRLLSGGPRGAVPRHRTLRAMMDWSYDLLSARERTLLRRLSVFVGGCTLEAVEQICAGGEIATVEILNLITELVDKSLISLDDQSQRTRYQISETVRQYAQDKLIGSGETEELRRRHLNYYTGLADAGSNLAGADQTAWQHRLAPEQDNLRAALEWAQDAKGGVEIGLRLSGALGKFWEKRNALSEGREWLRKFLTLSQDSFDANARGRAFYEAGYLAHIQGNDAEAISHYEQSLKIETQDRAQMARTHLDLGDALFRCADYGPALEHLNKTVNLGKMNSDSVMVALAQMIIGNVYHEQGDLDHAVENHRTSLEAFRAASQHRYIATALMNLGRAYFQRTDYAQSIEHYRQAIRLLENMDNPYTLCLIHSNLCEVYMDLGDFKQALESLDKCIKIAERMENDLLESIAYRNLAECYYGMGDLGRAMEQITHSLQHDDKNQTPHQRGVIFRIRGEIYAAMGQRRRAQEDYETARRLLEPLNYKSRLARLYRSYGKFLVAEADTRAQGIAYLEHALALFQTLESSKEVEKTEILLNIATDKTLEHVSRKEI